VEEKKVNGTNMKNYYIVALCIKVVHHLVVHYTDRNTRLVGPLGTCS